MKERDVDQVWVPVNACTLPTAEQPLRVAEFDALFAELLIRVDRKSRDDAVILLRDEPGLVDRVTDLTQRETSCCSFFVFGVEVHGDELKLRVGVPTVHADVLVGLTDRAESLCTASGQDTSR